MFEITFAIWNHAWDDARSRSVAHHPGYEFDVTTEVIDDLLWGIVEFQRNRQTLMPVRMPIDEWESVSRFSHGTHPPAATYDYETTLASLIPMPIGEFAWNLALILDRLGFETAPIGTTENYHRHLGPFHLRFVKMESGVGMFIEGFLDVGWVSIVPENEFFTAVRRFSQSFTAALQREAPELLEWTSFQPFTPYRLPLRGE